MTAAASGPQACSGPPLHSRYKWELLALLCLAFFFHQADRAIFGVVLSDLRADLGLTDSQVGFTASVLFFTLAVMMPFAGFLGDVISRKWILTVCLVGWSSATLFTGSVHGLVGLVLLRSVATAGGESFYAPAACSMLAQFHQRTRALAMSIHQGALYFGVMTSGFLGGWIAERWGWRSAFYVYGGCGILLGIVFVFRLRDVPLAPATSGAAATASKVKLFELLGQLFRVPTALLLTIGFTAIVFVNNAYVVWAPELLREKFKLSLTWAGGYAMLFHHLVALFGVLFGGWLSDRWVLRRRNARLTMMVCSMALGVPAIFLVGMGSSLGLTCAAMAVFGLFRGLYECNTHAALFDVIEPQRRASAVGMMIMCAFLVGSTSPLLLGWLREVLPAGKGLSFGFALLAGAYGIGALAIGAALRWTFHRDRIEEPGV